MEGLADELIEHILALMTIRSMSSTVLVSKKLKSMSKKVRDEKIAGLLKAATFTNDMGPLPIQSAGENECFTYISVIPQTVAYLTVFGDLYVHTPSSLIITPWSFYDSATVLDVKVFPGVSMATTQNVIVGAFVVECEDITADHESYYDVTTSNSVILSYTNIGVMDSFPLTNVHVKNRGNFFVLGRDNNIIVLVSGYERAKTGTISLVDPVARNSIVFDVELGFPLSDITSAGVISGKVFVVASDVMYYVGDGFPTSVMEGVKRIDLNGHVNL